MQSDSRSERVKCKSQAYNLTWPAGSPPLSEKNYIGCFAAQLDGYIRIYNNTDLRDLTSDHPTAYYNRFRCEAPSLRLAVPFLPVAGDHEPLVSPGCVCAATPRPTSDSTAGSSLPRPRIRASTPS